MNPLGFLTRNNRPVPPTPLAIEPSTSHFLTGCVAAASRQLGGLSVSVRAYEGVYVFTLDGTERLTLQSGIVYHAESVGATFDIARMIVEAAS